MKIDEMDGYTDPGFSVSEPVGNQGLQKPKTDQLSFIEINAVTWKLTDGKGVNAWDGTRVGYRTTRAVAWLMGIGNGLWIVRYRNKASKQAMKLNVAKKHVLEMLKGTWQTRAVTNPIGDLNRASLDALEPMPTLAELWAIETENYPPLTWPPRAEPPAPLQGDDYPLTYDADGELPVCLNRRKARDHYLDLVAQ